MTFLYIIIAVLVIVAVVAIVLGVRARRAAAQPPAQAAPTDPFGTGDQDALRGDPRKLRAGDIVEIREHTYTVRGSLRFSEGGWTWDSHLLDDARGTQVWLEVEEDPDLELSLWTDAPDAPEPGARQLEHAGRTFRREESGSAEFRSEATTGLDEAGTVRYYDYEASDGTMLGYESYGEAEGSGGAEWEASTGEELTRYEVRVYPAAG
ncbi:DUF4178 domain-containing protein [Salinifilum ghardaiensis]